MELNANAFGRNARKALLDKTLQEALGRTTGRFQAHRDAAVAAFPEFEATRERASRIKRDVLDHLDTYLARFIEEAENGARSSTWPGTRPRRGRSRHGSRGTKGSPSP